MTPIESFKDLQITSDEQLRKIGQNLGLHINYIGFNEELENIPIGVNIINLGDDGRFGTGTHWCLLYNANNHFLCYFDSYGVPPENTILWIAKKENIPVYYNTKQVQRYEEAYCGIWALMMADAIDKVPESKKISAFNEFLNNYVNVS